MKINILINYERHLKETAKVSNSGKSRHAYIARNYWTKFMKHPIQQILVDFCNKICHVKSKSEEPESFLSKKDHSPKTSKEPSSPSLDNFVDLDY